MDELRFGSRSLHPWRELRAHGRPVALGRPPLVILSVLPEAGGEVVSKDILLQTVWPNVVVAENALQIHVSALRKALGREAGRLKTVRGVGYRLDTASAANSGLEENIRSWWGPKDRLRIDFSRASRS